MFSKLNTLLGRASERSIETLWNRIGNRRDRFPQNECENSFKAAGYELFDGTLFGLSDECFEFS